MDFDDARPGIAHDDLCRDGTGKQTGAKDEEAIEELH
jgi:hypothetical protein